MSEVRDSDQYESIIGEAGERSFHRPTKGLVIETQRLLLNAPTTDDAMAIVLLADNAAVARNLVGMPHPYRIEHAFEWIAEDAGPGGQKHLICLKAPNGAMTPVGAVTLDFRRGARIPTLGCWFGEGYWGRGFATEACHAVIDYAFLHQGHDKLSFTCRVTNQAGRRVIEKCGFQLVAQELGHARYQGAVVPVDRFQMDRRTWESLRAWEPLRLHRRADDEALARTVLATAEG
jgi:RimJ/RimL family protein N-acetyltransferase